MEQLNRRWDVHRRHRTRRHKRVCVSQIPKPFSAHLYAVMCYFVLNWKAVRKEVGRDWGCMSASSAAFSTVELYWHLVASQRNQTAKGPKIDPAILVLVQILSKLRHQLPSFIWQDNNLSYFCRYQNIQRTMATEEDGGSPRLERSNSTETDSEPPQTGAIISLIIIIIIIILFSIYSQSKELKKIIIAPNLWDIFHNLKTINTRYISK